MPSWLFGESASGNQEGVRARALSVLALDTPPESLRAAYAIGELVNLAPGFEQYKVRLRGAVSANR